MGWTVIPTAWGEFRADLDGGHLVELRFPGSSVGEPAAPSPLQERLSDQLAAYLAGAGTAFDLPLRLRGTAFQKSVWRELLRVPYGTTITYGELAARIGRPHAARAVGQAVGANPVPIVVPCHRVLPAGGGLGGFGPGLEWKERLLALEGAGS
ncbi:MAG: Methylated-DNA--protein-cysteine methyltransferase [Candidatus Bipolaricaulis sibiricus]|uniref:Methylated-DNA--protein-cysteine methyltransferase n=1 Tax=Bipolaricaulis sibiricus TaxID=2501609 RepID=A0A410FW71_BIPS1|nr:MAG: Methylated-DNA--protein-cysteine methyltransferase [Candidatus Bipolaricaulis sibiricus]